MAARPGADQAPSQDHTATPLPASATEFAGLRCLVLGGGGFLGQALMRTLAQRGADVQGFGRTAPPEPTAGLDRTRPWIAAAFEDAAALAGALAGQDIVFHLASSSLPEASNRDPAGDLGSSVLPTLKLLELCRSAGVRKVVFASSGGTVYGIPAQVPTPEAAPTSPICAYGIGKLVVERYLELYRHLHGLDYQVLRIANPYGPGQSPFRRQGVVAAVLHRGLRGQPVELWGTGEVTRDFIHVDDVAAAFAAAALYEGPHRVMNVGSGHGRSLNAILADVATTLGVATLTVVRKPGRAADVPVSILDTALIRGETGWQPQVRWMDGLADAAAWIRTTFPPAANLPVMPLPPPAPARAGWRLPITPSSGEDRAVL